MEWISVKDRLPKCGERVILCSKHFIGEGYAVESGAFYREYGVDWSEAFEELPTHWMPLPERPEETE